MRLPSDPDGGLDRAPPNWQRIESSLGGGDRLRPTRGASSAGGAAQAGSTYTDGAAIAIATFSGIGHAQQAHRALAQIANRATDLSNNLAVHSNEKGSMVIYGHYASFDDPAMRRDQKRLKQYTVDGKRIFGLVLPAQLRAPLHLDTMDPLNLHVVRLRNPNVRALYTLEVAWWGPTEDRRGVPNADAAAESMARTLRRSGHEAFFLHQPHRRRHSVCVGVFDYQAIDASSELESIQVIQTRRSFPSVQINGTRQTVPLDARRPNGPSKPLAPALIDIPRP